MTENDWHRQSGFGCFADPPLFHSASARQLVLASVAWFRRFDRFWSPLPSSSEIIAAVFSNTQMNESIGQMERWADGGSSHDLDGAAQNAREAATFARVLFEDLVEDNEDRVIEARADMADAVAEAIVFVCGLAAWVGIPSRSLADGLTGMGDRRNPRLPPFVPDRYVSNLSSPQQRVLDAFADLLHSLVDERVRWVDNNQNVDPNVIYDFEYAAESHLVRDIFGNPFRPVTFAPEWRTAAAVGLASAMYESRDFAALPILADALQDAGCELPEILDHCRELGPHVRGCWVVDLVLGKS